MSELAAIALGSNLGDRQSIIERALADLVRLGEVVCSSPAIETEPVGPPGQGPYLNAACLLRTERTPRDLLDALLAIELAHGRDRSGGQRWGPRTLDLDLLLFGSRVIDEPGLTVPHPRLHERLFVLEPLAQIAPDLVVPTLCATVACLLERLRSAS